MTNPIPTPAGSYAFQITATDSTLALTGSTSFTVNIPLNVTHTTIATA